MRRFLVFLLLLVLVDFTLFAQRGNVICRPGFTFEISNNLNWGYNLPVVTSITPYSQAELSGLKMYDIIEEIDGIMTSEISRKEIEQLLNPYDRNEVALIISNLTDDGRRVLIKKDCKRANAIDESQLATAFSMMSLENTSERTFVCPFKTTVTSESIGFSQFRTFAFGPIDESNRVIESEINDYIKAELTKKGLVYDLNMPEMIIQTFYFLDKNPTYRGANRLIIEKEQNYRYNFAQDKMEKVPFLSHSAPESEAEYLLQFGFRIVDNIYKPGRVLWECEANELLESGYNLGDYARMHIPLMCMQYPYVKYMRNVQYRVSKKTYNYTGLSYDIDQLEMVTKVDPGSPAAMAGVRVGDIIEKIEGASMNMTAEKASSGYKEFITKTMSLRDPKTLFTDANGFTRCMFWDTFKYRKVAEAIRKKEEIAPFAYLFYFAPYVNPSGTNTCTFSLKQQKVGKTEVIIRPTIRTESTISIE